MATPLGRAVNAARLMRASAKFPDTFAISKVTLGADGSACFAFSARNQFAQQFPGMAILSAEDRLSLNDAGKLGGLDMPGTPEPGGKQFAGMWERHCRSGTDQTAAVNDVLQNSVF